MEQAIQPYLHFDEACREAMQFYQSVFGGTLQLMPISESPARDQFPAEIQHQILHASLQNGELLILASDMCGQGKAIQGNSIQLSLNCSSEDEINNLYRKLPEGGTIIQELKEEFWGALFAMLIDKYGVRWMLSYEKN